MLCFSLYRERNDQAEKAETSWKTKLKQKDQAVVATQNELAASKTMTSKLSVEKSKLEERITRLNK